jgi:hypothetical protein
MGQSKNTMNAYCQSNRRWAFINNNGERTALSRDTSDTFQLQNIDYLLGQFS